MELMVWNGQWGLPCIDADCLYSLAYSKMCAAPVDIQHCNNSRISPTGSLPLLTDGATHYAGGKKIVDELKIRGYDLDVSLTLNQQSDLSSYKILVEKKLIPAVQYTFWCIQENYHRITHPSWSSFLPFLSSIHYPLSKKHTLSSRMETLYSLSNQDDLLKKVMAEAKECLNILSYKMEENDFILGSRATSLDALVFAQLMLLLYTDLPQSPLKVHVMSCPNLQGLCQRITKKYFPDSSEEISRLEKEHFENEKKRLKESSEFPHKKRDIVVAVGIVSAVMITYALVLGIVHIEVINIEKIKK